MIRGSQLLALVVTASAALACERILALEDAHEIDDGGGATGGLGGVGAVGGTGGAGGSAGSSGASSGGVAGSTSGGAGGSTGGSGGLEDAGDADTGPPPPLCETYCKTVLQNCTGTFAVYADLSVCQAVCAALPEGSPGDTKVNSVHCRLSAAVKAKIEAITYCPGAGPGGQGQCGENCDGYCSLMEGICTGTNQKFPNTADCLAACTPLPDLGTFNTTEASMYSGNHVQCRLFHVSAASFEDPELHCGHAAGALPCS